MSANYFWGALLGLLPITGFAQNAPRLYLGAGAVLMRFAPFESYARNYVGPAGTLGIRFNANWAVETGVQVTWDKQVYTSNYSASTTTLKSSAWLVPLLARYTFGAPEGRLRVDALGGLSLLHGRSEVETVSQVGPYGYRSSSTELGLVLGPQVRYALGPAFDVKLNLPFNVDVSGSGDFIDRLFLTPQLGVQYSLGQ